MNFPSSFLDEIRARLAVSDVVARKVKLKKRGREFVGLSPFNPEKTPSFTVNDQKGFYHCFSSGNHGDIFTFVMEMEGLSFPEAVERLAGEAGVPMPAPDPQSAQTQARRASLYDVMELAAAFFEDRLQSSEGAAARGYLADRGLEAANQKLFRLGYASQGRHVLKEFLASRNITQEQMIDAGLLIAGEDIAVSYDRFRDRVIFPITDRRGKVIAFGGRALSADAPAKYLNSPETELFHKGAILYNLANAREGAHKAGQVIVVEGYMDVIAMHQAGFANCVAPLGTALTGDQIALLWRMSPEPILCFDGDKAGLKAAYRAGDTALALLKPGFSLKFAGLPSGLDPDDVLRDHGLQVMEEVINTARPLIDMLWAREIEGGDFSTPERRAGFEVSIKSLADEISDPGVKHHYQAALRERLERFWQKQAGPAHSGGARANNWRAGANGSFAGSFTGKGNARIAKHKIARAPTRALRTSPLASALSKPSLRREWLILQTLLNHPGLLGQYSEEFAAVEFSAMELDNLRNGILEIAARRDGLDKDVLRDDLKARDLANIATKLEQDLGAHIEWFCSSQTAEIDAETGWLHVLALHRKSMTLKRELKAAERALALDQSEENLEVMLDVQRQLEGIEGKEATVEGFGEASDKRTGTDY